MGIENFPGIKPGDIIDLSKFEKTKKEPSFETYLPSLNEIALKLNKEVNEKFPYFINKEGQIGMNGFSEEEIEKDRKDVLAKEKLFSGDDGKDKVEWSRDKKRNPSNITEIALTILLQKSLGKDFIVARSSKYDDYLNGVDQVIVYVPTGEVVCGFDEVIGNVGDDGGEKKKEKLEKIMTRGGANIKYGAQLKDGKLVRSEVKNVPAFYVSLSKENLRELLESLKNNSQGDTEQKIFSKLLASLENQAAGQKMNSNLRTKTDSMLDKFRRAINTKDITNNIAA
jgi:hypothetical protein